MNKKFKQIPIEDEKYLSELISNIIFDIDTSNLNESNLLEIVFTKMSKEDSIRNFFDIAKIKNRTKDITNPNKRNFSEKFLKLNEHGKIKYLFLLFQQLKSNAPALQSILYTFSRYLYNNPTFNNIDKIILDNISQNEELKKIFMDVIFVGSKKDTPSFNAIGLRKTIEYLYNQKLIPNDTIFSAYGLSSMNKGHENFIINNIDAKNVHNLVNYGGLIGTYKKGENPDFSLDINEVYKQLEQNQNYSSLFNIMNQINGKTINLNGEELKFFMYLIYCSKMNSIPYQATTNELCSESTVSNILSNAINSNNLQGVLNIFELFKKIKSNKYGVSSMSALKDSLNFCLAYSDKEIFKELCNKDIQLTNPELIQKIIYLSQHSAFNEIKDLKSLNETKMEDFSKMTVDISKSNGDMNSVRYHTFKKDTDRKDRSIIVIDKEGNKTIKGVNGHHIGLQELYGVSTYNHLTQISQCVNQKDDTIIISADEFIEIFFNKKVNKEQLTTILKTIGDIKDLATYIVGVCSDDLSVNSLNGNDEPMDYNAVVNLLNQMGLSKEQQEEQIMR